MRIYSFNITAKRIFNQLFIGSVLMTILCSSCNALFEEDISASTPSLIIPTANDTIKTNQVHFKWLEMEGAAFYNLQIVTPSFSDIDYFILDSNINATGFYQVLEPGNYAFQLRGENGGYTSMYAGPFSFYVDSVADLSSQFISLVSPGNNIYTNGYSPISISWQNLYAASRYEYILKYGADFTSGSVLDQDLNIYTLAYSISSEFITIEGSYFWGIKGANETSSTPYTSRQINVDQTAPNDPILVSPANDAVFPVIDPVTLKWSNGVDPGIVHAPVISAVEISTFVDFATYTEITGISTDSLVYTFPGVGTYYWRVKAEDEAGNFSAFYSPQRTLILE